MQFLPDTQSSGILVKHYEKGAVTINTTTYRSSIIITSSEVISDWQPPTFAEVQPEHLQPLLELEMDVLILGCGEIQRFLPPAMLQPFMQRNIGAEIMTTAAACRTFNVLAGEGRKVVAGLFLQ